MNSNFKLKIKNSQKGVSLIITFLIMTIILVIVLNIGTILSNEVKIISVIGSSAFSFYAVDTGIEKTLYFDRKKISAGANRGFCDICDSCNDPAIDPANYCNNCTVTPLVGGGCDSLNCKNCQLDYTSTFSGQTYSIFATTPDTDVPNFIMDLKGYYNGVTRKIQLR